MCIVSISKILKLLPKTLLKHLKKVGIKKLPKKFFYSIGPPQVKIVPPPLPIAFRQPKNFRFVCAYIITAQFFSSSIALEDNLHILVVVSKTS